MADGDVLVVDISAWFDHSRESFNQVKFTEYLKEINSEEHDKALIIFDGVEQLTDESLYVLSESKHADHLRNILTDVSAVGCVHLTDWGVKTLAKACAKLEKVTLDGCLHLTDKSITYLMFYCDSLKSISMAGTGVTYLPPLLDNKSVEIRVNGCSIFDNQVKSKDSDTGDFAPRKVVILSREGVEYSFIDTLKSGKFVPRTKDSKKIVFEDTCLSTGDQDKEEQYQVNLIEIQDKMVHFSPFMTEETSYVILATMDDIKEGSAQLNIIQYLNAIKAVTEHVAIVILILHKDDAKQEVIDSIEGLSQALDDCITAHFDTNKEHLQLESFNSKKALRKDFLSQKRYVKSMIQQQRTDVYHFMKVNVDTLQLQQYSLQESRESKKDAAAVYQEWAEGKGAKAKEMLNSVNKSELSELKSMKRPPLAVQASLSSMLILLNVMPTKTGDIETFVQNCWAPVKKQLSDSSLLSKLDRFDPQFITDKALVHLDEIFKTFQDVMNEDLQMKVSSFSRKIFVWVDAMRSYAKITRDINESRRTYPAQKGVDVLLRKINGINSSTIGINFKQGHTYSPVFQEFYNTFPRNLKICRLLDFIDSLPKKFYGSNTADYENALKKLHVMGRCLFFPQVIGKPVVGDVQHFMDLIACLSSLPKSYDNNRRLTSLALSVALLTEHSLKQLWEQNVSSDQFALVLEVMRHFGILLEVPYVRRQLTDPPYYLVPACTLSEKWFFHAKKESEYHTMLMTQMYWPKFHLSPTKETDVEVNYDFKFTMCYPSNLTAWLLREIVKLGGVTLLWSKGCLVTKGAVEIFIFNNMHGVYEYDVANGWRADLEMFTIYLVVLFSDTIEVGARVTKGTAETMAITHEYLWSALNPYLLLIEYMVDQYPLLGAKHRIPCPGNCSESVAHTFSPVELVPGQSLKCPTCSEPVEESKRMLMSGRKRVAHIHQFITIDWQVTCTMCQNCVKPLQELCPYNHIGDELSCRCVNFGWCCRNCGICRRCSALLWKMDKFLYPSFTSASFTAIAPSSGQLSGNIVCLPDGSTEDSSMTVACSNAFSKISHTTLCLVILDEGPVTITIDKIDPRYKEADDEIVFKFEAHTGTLTSEGQTRSLGNEAVCHTGDTLIVEVVRDYEKVVDKKLSFFRTVELRKNNCLLTTAELSHGCGSTITLSSDGEKKPRVIIYSPSAMTLTSAHFDAGAAMIFHTGVGNTWSVGRIATITEDGDLVLADDKGSEYKFKVTSENILPACFSQELNLLLNGEPCVAEKKLAQYLLNHGYTTPQWSLFNYSRGFQPHKPVNTWFCSEGIYSYRAIQTVISNFGVRSTKGFKPNFGIALLPFTDFNRYVLVPSRQVAQNWEKLSYMLLCPGSSQMDINVGTAVKDWHIMLRDIQEIKDGGELFAHKGTLQFLILCHVFLLQNQVVLPTGYEALFPTDLNLSETELTDGLVRMLHLQLQSCLLKTVYVMGSEFIYNFSLLQSGGKMMEKRLLGLLEAESIGVPCQVHKVVWHVAKNKKKHVNKNKPKDEEQMDALPLVDANSCYNPCVRGVKPAPDCTRDHLVEFIGYYPNILHLCIQRCDVKTGVREIARLCPRLEILELVNNDICELPEELEGLKNSLIHLKVSEPSLKGALPEWLAKFRRLRYLQLDESSVSALPENVGDLPLMNLTMKNCPIRRLPPSFQKLKRLSTLKIPGIPWPAWQKNKTFFSMNEWKSYYEQIGYYNCYEPQEDLEAWFQQFEVEPGKLDFSGFSDFVDFLMWNVPRLQTDPETKTCGGVPPEIFHCQSLRVLEMQYQAFTEIPEDICHLRRIDVFNVAHCKLLERINEKIGVLNLRVLALADTPNLHTPPQEVVSKGMHQTIVYLKRLGEGSRACMRTKLMFVGLGGAGKTSLMRALMSSDYKAPITQNEAITDGIDITTWTISRNKETVSYSVWDFAGQTLYYHTHQFFLSSRSVYLLMWNTRLGFEHAGLDFWLSSIRCHAPQAPIFVIGTHADKVSKSELPAEKLKEKYPSIVSFHLISSLTGQGVENLLDSIIKATLEQPYIEERIPDAWLNFESAILGKRSTESVMDWSVVKQLASKCGLFDDEVNQAVQFIHELGSIQHFPNERLRNKVVINPQWIVDVMACVVSVHNSVIQNGELKHRDIGVIWKNYDNALHTWLLHLTEAFDLTFPLGDKPVNIVPCLLPQVQPHFEWPDVRGEKDLRETKIEYTFDYLPAGLFNRIQVRLSEFSDQATIWKTGSLLNKNSHLALIMQKGDTVVIVKVQGPRPENILLLIHEVFESLITESFHGVRYEYQVPCSECMEANLKEPTMFSAGVLHSALELKAMFLQCHKRFHTLSISHIQTTMPPDSTTDFDLHLQNMVQDLGSLQNNFPIDLFFLYCASNAPADEASCSWVHPKVVQRDLEEAGFTTTYIMNLKEEKLDDVAIRMSESKIVLVFISDDFVADETCQRMFRHVKENLKKPILLLVVGNGYEWQKSDIGMQMAKELYFPLHKPEWYKLNFNKLETKLALRTGKKDKDSSSEETDVFISYAWSNSQTAIDMGEAAARAGSVGYGDPRQIKEYLESEGISCWLDTERVGTGGLFEDIAEGFKKTKVVVACISDEYTLSPNCQMEFRFAHVTLKLPIIVCVVGTGLNWESTEIGMLSLGYPRINFQINNAVAKDRLLDSVREKLSAAVKKQKALTKAPKSSVADVSQQRQSAFQELFELAQRKFLRQLTNYSDKNVVFPRIFVVDSTDTDVEKEEDPAQEPAGDESTLELEDSPVNYCFKVLCEHDGGWHCTSNSVPITTYDLKTFWSLLAPYMGRVLTILKHSDINLNLLQSTQGKSLISFFEQNCGSSSQISRLYKELRRYLQLNCPDNCGLKRCLLPSGRILWLCPEHQVLPRVSVLDTKAPPVDQDVEYDESALLLKLIEIAERAQTVGNEEEDDSTDIGEDADKTEEPSGIPQMVGRESSTAKLNRLKYALPIVAQLSSRRSKSKACVVM